MSKILSQDHDGYYRFYCPGCKHCHAYRTTGPIVWEFNNNMEKPSFNPSLLNTKSWKDPKEVCHLYVTDGKIHYCSDCTHELAGKVVDMVELNET